MIPSGLLSPVVIRVQDYFLARCVHQIAYYGVTPETVRSSRVLSARGSLMIRSNTAVAIPGLPTCSYVLCEISEIVHSRIGPEGRCDNETGGRGRVAYDTLTGARRQLAV